MNLKLGATALSGCLLMGCATITRGSHETFVVESTPPNARVQLSTGLTCDATPCSFRIERKGSFAVTVSKEGYKTSTYNVTTQVAGAGAAGMAGNVLIGGLIGIGVDAATGATLEHKPNPLQITLENQLVMAQAPTAETAAVVQPVSPTTDATSALAPTTSTAPAPTAAPSAQVTPTAAVAPTPAASTTPQAAVQ